MTARTTLLAATALVALPALAQDAAPELAEASIALDAATSLGLVEMLASGDAYTAFIPTNEALEAVQGEETTAVMGDEAAFTTLIQGYVVEGTVMAADAMGMVEAEGGSHTATSLAGTPLEIAMSGDSLTVNGATVTTPDIMLGNVTIHLIDTAFLPEAAGTDAAAAGDAAASDDMAADDAMATDDAAASDDMASDDMATDDAAATDDMATDDAAGDASGG